ncbi:hypothetical protein SELMODRAFT_230488 [Selaginella moellendorffii]|uniref:Uncharacterized protein n=1 Tax=Selaginella moellendorffii TaxID=88036 RepID=D8R1S9_SELML|nr:L-ascorbate oxidase homolog [Selaginella moellendorffii]EFJ33947.1 hypothetical protein SELMODRAFT_230488 [Selaginella moellendorffii]|eukprot:XP_002965109.1 L-ascorbate oxidase homolog [Selaginella moellendorffii]
MAVIAKFLAILAVLALASTAQAADPDQFLDWVVTFQNLPLLDTTQRVIAINNQFPGPTIKTTTNNNLHINVTNRLDEPLLFHWNGIQQRRSSWQDGVSGTNCPILPGQSWQYNFQVKDQIGTFFYYPSINFHKAAGGYGGIQIANRVVIAVPFLPPADDFTLLAGDWQLRDYRSSRSRLDKSQGIGRPNVVLMNGKAPYIAGGSNANFEKFTVESGKIYRFRISNVGTAQSLNVRIQSHKLCVVETEGSYTAKTCVDSLDIHLGQSYSVLVTMDQSPADYYIVASTKFSSGSLNGVAILHYQNSNTAASGTIPAGPDPLDVNFSLNQALSIKWNLTTGAARPNPQGSYHYGQIPITRVIQLSSSSVTLNNQARFAINGQSYLTPDTPLKLADFYNIDGVFTRGSMRTSAVGSPVMETSVLELDYKSFVELVFVNPENEIQSWHLDGMSFWVVGFGFNETWSPSSRSKYNLVDAVSRSTTQVYPRGWTAILFSVDNVGMWNIRSQCLRRQYLGQEGYARVFNPENSTRTETWIPQNVILCGKAIGKTIPGPRMLGIDEIDL